MHLLLWTQANENALVAAENHGEATVAAIVVVLFLLLMAGLTYAGQEEKQKGRHT